jgi:hypothetical protein
LGLRVAGGDAARGPAARVTPGRRLQCDARLLERFLEDETAERGCLDEVRVAIALLKKSSRAYDAMEQAKATPFL